MARAIRGALLALVSLVLLAALAWWLLTPHTQVAITVERVAHRAALANGTNTGGVEDGVSVTFVAPEDLGLLRQRLRAQFILATLFGCNDRETTTREIVTQSAEYFTDNKRVRLVQRLPDGRARYNVVFHDVLMRVRKQDGRLLPVSVTAAPGGLCFALDGGSTAGGRIWSRPARLTKAV